MTSLYEHAGGEEALHRLEEPFYAKVLADPVLKVTRTTRRQAVKGLAVGGLTLEQAVATPEYGAPLVVLGAPLTIDADAFKTAGGDLEGSLRLICQKVHGYGDVPVGAGR